VSHSAAIPDAVAEPIVFGRVNLTYDSRPQKGADHEHEEKYIKQGLSSANRFLAPATSPEGNNPADYKEGNEATENQNTVVHFISRVAGIVDVNIMHCKCNSEVA
jgi:hypothetical protein